MCDLDAPNVMVDDISPEQRLHARQQLRRLAQAFDLLSPKCREVVWMRRVDELSQREVASRLGISQKTVEKHIMKGMRLLAEALFADGCGGPDQAGSGHVEGGAERLVDLERGEAFFEVARGLGRPFVVRAGDERVIAVGTKCSVRRSDDDIRVFVAEGQGAARA